jgi:hypothetical protein
MELFMEFQVFNFNYRKGCFLGIIISIYYDYQIRDEKKPTYDVIIKIFCSILFFSYVFNHFLIKALIFFKCRSLIK